MVYPVHVLFSQVSYGSTKYSFTKHCSLYPNILVQVIPGLPRAFFYLASPESHKYFYVSHFWLKTDTMSL